jgi:hypothetical protein
METCSILKSTLGGFTELYIVLLSMWDIVSAHSYAG